MAIRWYFGKKAGRNLDQRLYVVNEMSRLWETKDSIKNEREATTTISVGVVHTSRLLQLAMDAFKKYNVNGHGSVKSSIVVKRHGKELVTHACNTLVCLSHNAMPKSALDVLVTADHRLEAMYNSLCFDGPELQPHHYATIATSTGDAVELQFSNDLQLTTNSATVIESESCNVTKKALFTKSTIDAFLFNQDREATRAAGWNLHTASYRK